MEYNFGTLDLGTYFFRPARVKHGHFTTMEGGATWLLRSDGELAQLVHPERVGALGRRGRQLRARRLADATSQSTADLGAVARTWRSDRDLEDLQRSVQFQWDQGADDAPYVQHGLGTDHSLVAIAKALDAASLQGGHSGDDHATTPRPRPRPRHDHARGHGHVHDGTVTTPRRRARADDEALGWADPALLEHRGRAHRRARAQLGRRPAVEVRRPVPRADPVQPAGPQPLEWPLGRRRHVAPPPLHSRHAVITREIPRSRAPFRA